MFGCVNWGLGFYYRLFFYVFLFLCFQELQTTTVSVKLSENCLRRRQRTLKINENPPTENETLESWVSRIDRGPGTRLATTPYSPALRNTETTRRAESDQYPRDKDLPLVTDLVTIYPTDSTIGTLKKKGTFRAPKDFTRKKDLYER